MAWSRAVRSLAGSAVVVGLAVASVATRPGTPTSERPWVVIVSLDTVRADALGAYGGSATTPHLDALAARSVTFTRHFAAAPTTLASHTALMTGTWPHTHGVPRNGFRVDDANVMLAEILRDAGWRTAGFAGAEPLAASTGFSQGFDVWDELDPAAGTYERPGREVVDHALAWIDGEDVGDGVPRLLFVHLYDAHAPYVAPQGYVDRLGPLPPTSAKEPGSRAHVGHVRQLHADGDPAAAAEGRVLRQLYLANLGWLDHQVGRLLHGLRSRGILDRALLVVTADHGEAFDDHEEAFDHGYGVYDETTRIPLLMAGPSLGSALAPRTIDRLGSNVDVLPSVLDLLGLPVPDGVDGVSFAPTLRGADQRPRGVVFSEATKPYDDPDHGWTNRERTKSARTAALRLVWDPGDDRRSLYATARDPDELDDRWRADGDRPEVRALDLALSAWAADPHPLPTVPLEDAETRAALEALGYVDGPSR